MFPRRRWILGVCAAAGLAASVGCTMFSRPVESTLERPPTIDELAELWVEPTDLTARDLLHGVGGPELAPNPADRYELLSKGRGLGEDWEVKDGHGRRWNVRMGPEAQAEIAVSRLVWAAGYHQLPAYLVRDWTLTGGPDAGPQPSGRFRPHLPGTRGAGAWSWHRNPFVRTRAYRGLLVLMMVVNDWDLRDPNNVVYELDRLREGARRWYVVRDLGGSLGRPDFLPQGSRNDVLDFEQEGFVKGIADGYVKFAYQGRHRELLKSVTPADVRWICGLLSRLTPRQWEDAFRAAGYDPEKSSRYIRKLREKVEQGRILGGAEGAAP
jgi:hypothetical protein